MAEINLTQQEADLLLEMPKIRAEEKEYEYPMAGGSVSIPLVSEDKKEQFFLDISRGRIDLAKGTYQNRIRQSVILARLDFGGQPHRNPDGEEVSSPHLHLYREGYGDKYAHPLPKEKFSNVSNPWLMLEDFLMFCNVVEKPKINKGLFV